jgi:hypothetical protein
MGDDGTELRLEQSEKSSISKDAQAGFGDGQAEEVVVEERVVVVVLRGAMGPVGDDARVKKKKRVKKGEFRQRAAGKLEDPL